jgi:hypothetical protein
MAAAGLTALALTFAGSVLVATPAAAADFTVTNNTDSGPGSLRAAIEAANAAPGANTIDVSIGIPTTITLLSTITVTDSVSIDNLHVAPTITRSAAFDMIVLDPAVDGVDFRIDGEFTFTGGGFSGSAIYSAQDENLEYVDVIDVRFQNLFGESAIHLESVTGIFSVTDATFVDNSSGAGGGAIFFGANPGNIFVNNSVFEGNGTFGDGGAIKVVQSNNVVIAGSSFTGNGAGVAGGAISVGAAEDVLITGASTFTSNEVVDGSGGALSVNSVDDVDLSDTQWILNTAGADEGASVLGGAVNASNTGAFTVERSLFSQNSATATEESFVALGGAIALNEVDGLATILENDFAQNSAIATDGDARGGAMFLADMGEAVNISSSQFTSNEINGGSGGPGTAEMGAAIAFGTVDVPLTIDGSSFDNQILSENVLGALSIGVGVVSDEFTIVNSTFNEPLVLDGFGARPPMVYVTDFDEDGVFLAEHSTFIGGYAIRLNQNEVGTFSVSHSAFESNGEPILAEHTDVPTSYSAFSHPDPGTIVNTVGNKIGVALLLGPYGENGGPTKTAVPQTGSALIDTGNAGIVDPPVFDQRGFGFERVVRVIDIGAVEVQAPALAATGSAQPWWALAVGMLLLLGGATVLRLRARAIH